MKQAMLATSILIACSAVTAQTITIAPNGKTTISATSEQADTVSTAAATAENTWYTDFAAAKKAAAAAKKPILALFTGTEWCPWCVKLEKEILVKPEFIAYAKTSLILYKADFKRDGSASTEAKTLRSTYSVEGYPTVVITDAAGKKYGETGYTRKGPSDFIGKVSAIIEAGKLMGKNQKTTEHVEAGVGALNAVNSLFGTKK